MEIKILQIVLIILCIISIVPIIIFFKRKDRKIEEIYKLIENYNDITKTNLEELTKGNKKIDEIEKKILICKQKLKIKKYE